MSQFVRECAKLLWGKIEEHFQNVVSFVGASIFLLGRGSGIFSFSFKNSNVFCLVFSKVWSSWLASIKKRTCRLQVISCSVAHLDLVYSPCIVAVVFCLLLFLFALSSHIILSVKGGRNTSRASGICPNSTCLLWALSRWRSMIFFSTFLDFSDIQPARMRSSTASQSSATWLLPSLQSLCAEFSDVVLQPLLQPALY